MRIPRLRSNGDGRGFVEIPRSGRKRVYFGKLGTPECDQKYREWVARFVLYEGESTQTSDTRLQFTVAKVAKKYLEWAKTYYAKHGQPTREWQGMKTALLPLLEISGSEPAKEFSVQLLKLYAKHIAGYGVKKGDQSLTISRSYANKLVARVKRFVKWAEVEGYVLPNT